jgi:hypothetical protein
MIRFSIALLLSSTLSTAVAVPMSFQHQARVLDAGGSPLNGSHTVIFTLYGDATNGPVLWTESKAGVPFNNGYMSVTIGDPVPVPGSALAVDDVWIGMAIDSGAELAPRPKLTSAAFAVRAGAAATADVATSVSGGVVNATEVQIGGQTVINTSGTVTANVDWGNLQNVPSAVVNAASHTHNYSELTNRPTTLSNLSCGTNQIAKYNGSAWVCASDASQSFRLTCTSAMVTTTQTSTHLMQCPSGYIATGSGWQPASNWDTSTSHHVSSGTDATSCSFYIGGLVSNWNTSCTCCKVVAN